MSKNRIYLIGIAIILFHLIIHLLIIRDYPIAWDYHYHHFAGLYHLGLPVPSVSDPAPVPFTPPDPRLTVEDPFGPFTQIIPSFSQVLLADKLKLLPFDVAYNLPIVIIGSLGVGVLFVFIAQSIGFWQGIFSALFLSLFPVYFGYVHTSMKDVGNAVAFAVSLWMFWRLTKYQRIRDLFMAVISFAVAFNIKINSVMIPVICAVWYVIMKVQSSKFKVQSLVILHFLLAPLAALALWLPFWRDPIGKLLSLPYFYSHNTLGMPVLLLGQLYRSGFDIPFYYPWIYIAVNVPLGILFFSIVGFIKSLILSLKGKHIYTLIILWLLLPLVRYFSTSTGAIDGMRHFLEITYPLSVFASIGIYSLMRVGIHRLGKAACFIAAVVVTAPLIYNIVRTHPYQTSFYNAITGGIRGAQAKFDIDYWGTPQKEAIIWLNRVAPTNAAIYVAMAQSSAAMYIRPDLLPLLNTKNIWESDFVVVLNRESFFEFGDLRKYLMDKLRQNNPIHTVTVDGVPLVWILRK